jgi:geranylgeranyl diphosphate synthase type II
MEYEKREQVTIAEYLEMIRLKTAVLIACSLKMGALLAGANARNCQLLYEFGILIGIAFQLQDDWLDVYGDEQTFGKQIGGDICENKKSCLLIAALELSTENDRLELQKWIDKPTFDRQEKIAAVRKIYTQSGADASARNLMNHYYTQAMRSLQQIDVEISAKSELEKFAAEVMSRVK